MLPMAAMGIGAERQPSFLSGLKAKVSWRIFDE
jgi:hypothetical protein